jgi:hypothetical protein
LAVVPARRVVSLTTSAIWTVNLSLSPQGGVRLKSSHAERDLDRGHAAGGRGHIAGGLRKQVTALQGRDQGW